MAGTKGYVTALCLLISLSFTAIYHGTTKDDQEPNNVPKPSHPS